LSHERGKKLKKTNKITENKKNTTKCPKFKCNTVSVSFPACRCSLVVVSSKGEKKKKESGDSSVNGYLRLGSPARCCQPAAAGGVIYADLRSELNTHLALQALFTQSSPMHEPLLQASLFQAHWGR
jgi:hypothetical protein